MVGPFIPTVTAGLLYTYLAGHVGKDGEQGNFRALAHGYVHWVSRQLVQLEVNVQHREYYESIHES